MAIECRLYRESADRGAGYGSDDVLDLGTDWEILHFLFTGSKEADGSVESFLVADWPQIDGSEASLIDQCALSSFNTWLNKLTDDDVSLRFDPAVMAAAGIYGAERLAHDPASVLARLRERIEALRSFLRHCAMLQADVVRVLI